MCASAVWEHACVCVLVSGECVQGRVCECVLRAGRQALRVWLWSGAGRAPPDAGGLPARPDAGWGQGEAAQEQLP